MTLTPLTPELRAIIRRVRAEMLAAYVQAKDTRPVCVDCKVERVMDVNHIVCKLCQRVRMAV